MADLGHTVDPDGTGDYTSLNALEAANEQDLTDGGGDTYTATCESSSGTADTTAVEFEDWVVGVANFITIINPNLVTSPDTTIDTSEYRLVMTSVRALRIRQDYTVVDGIQAVVTGAGFEVSNTSNTVTIQNCKIAQTANGIDVLSGGASIINTTIDRSTTGGAPNGILISGGASSTIENTIVKGDYDHGLSFRTGTGTIYNSIIDGAADDGIRVYAGSTLTIKNNAIFNSIGNDIDNRGTATIDYNATDDGTGSNPQTIVGDEFVDAANGDYTAVASTVIDGNGIGPGSDANVPTTDIDGTSRSGTTCDIGADEIAGGVAVTRSIDDTVGVTDTLSIIGTYIRLIIDTIGITAALAIIGTFKRQILDAVGVPDVLSFVVLIVKSIADTIGITSVLTKIGTFKRSIANTVGITDVISRVGTFFRSISDTIGLTDVLTSSAAILLKIINKLSNISTGKSIGSRISTGKEVDSTITTEVEKDAEL